MNIDKYKTPLSRDEKEQFNQLKSIGKVFAKRTVWALKDSKEFLHYTIKHYTYKGFKREDHRDFIFKELWIPSSKEVGKYILGIRHVENVEASDDFYFDGFLRSVDEVYHLDDFYSLGGGGRINTIEKNMVREIAQHEKMEGYFTISI